MRYAQLQQATDGARGVIGVQGREHQVTGECRLYGHFSGFQVTDLANHDDVRILPHQGAHAAGKGQVNVVLDLHLIERRFHHLDRVLDGAQVDLWRREFLQGGVERGGLA
ncbi:hypothetical protein D3C73_1216310 [compost metagenome]